MTWDNIGIGILTGTDPFHGSHVDIKLAVAQRFAEIKGSLVKRQGDYVYDGNRCLPENLGWRTIQNRGRAFPLDIIVGKHDSDIEATWHDAAAAEHWYLYEKDWGFGLGMGAFGE